MPERELLFTDDYGNDYVSAVIEDLRPGVVLGFACLEGDASTVNTFNVVVREVIPAHPNESFEGYRVRVQYVGYRTGTERVIAVRSDGTCLDSRCCLAIRARWVRKERVVPPTRSRVVTQVEAEE